MTYSFLPDTSGTPLFASSDRAVYANIMQSPSFINCHLIAALSSLAWVNNNFFANMNGTSFSLYDPSPNAKQEGGPGEYPDSVSITSIPVTVPVAINSLIYMDTETKFWNCATSKVPETWPAMYEKAYAKFCLFKIVKNIPYKALTDSSSDPDFSYLPTGSDWGGNPVTALTYLAGYPQKAFRYLTMAKNFSYPGGSYSGTDLYAFIKSLCLSSIGTATPYGKVNGGKTRFPVGAWTYYDEAAALSKANASIKYDSATIAADHCYSVLGIYENNGSNYIVLRNPYGRADPSPKQYSTANGSWIFYNFQSQYIGGNKYNVTMRPVPVLLDLSLADGIFALDAKVFHQYFEGFGFMSN